MLEQQPLHYPAVRTASVPERLIFGARHFILAFFTLATVFLGWQAWHLQPDASFAKLLPQQHPFIQNMNDHMKDLRAAGASLKVSVAVKRGDIFNDDYLSTLGQIADEIFYIPGVNKNGLKSLWSPDVRWTMVTEEGFEMGSVIPQDYDGSPASLQQLRTNLQRSGVIGSMVADDFKSTIIEVPIYDTDPTTGEQLNYLAFSRALEKQVRQQFESDNIRIHIIGFPKLIGELLEGIGAIFLFAAVTLLITCVLLYVYTRDLRATLAPLTCSLLAVIWQLGLLHLFGFGLNAYSILVPFLVLAIGVSHGVQMINAVALQLQGEVDRLQASRLAFRSLYIAGMTALISDGIGFITLLVIDIGVISELGIAASIGVACIICSNLVLLPVLVSYIGISKKGVYHMRVDPQRRHPLWSLISRCATPKVALVSVLVAAAGYAVGIAGARNLQVGDLDAGAPELRPDSRYNLDNAFITGNYAVSTDILVVMVETPVQGCGLFENIRLIDRFGWYMENVPGVQSAVSMADVVRLTAMALNEGNPRWQTLSRDQRAIDGGVANVPPALMNRDCSLALVVLFLDDHKAETLQRVVDAAQTFEEEYGTDQVRFKLAAGNAGIEAATNQEIAVAQTQILVLVYGVVAALVFLSFRSSVASACIIIPLGLTSALCHALMAWLGIGIKVATLPVVALGVGVGVDYGIYIYNRLTHYLRRGLPMQEAYYQALSTTGRAVAFTGFALGVGVITWAFSPIKFQADMGILLTFMFLLNMVGALWLLPALAYFLVKPEPPRKRESAGEAEQGDHSHVQTG
ncbi:RND family transporter [Mangrovimicrobium sediminis]|uniref:RND family transporter n=1 Tax=Mangrovimicrobium sediminis TaxID=2562682 RepID=A0A4Z0LUZ6_9GAMM|nr:efflux RND transporter permease subunit [Haliea sp. SAOS-164]TGD71111.1 RND family transporter [Haliea sp. SAOS-164]